MLECEARELLLRLGSSVARDELLVKVFTDVNQATAKFHWRELIREYILNSMERPAKNSKAKELTPYESDLTLLVNLPRPP